MKSFVSPKEPSRDNVWKLFDSISKRYDLINHLLSFGIDIYWRRKLATYLPRKGPLHLLDVATGTGSQLIAILKKAPQVTTALGIDLSQEMIRLGQKKLIDKGLTHRVALTRGDATAFSLREKSFDCATISFGIRNVGAVNQALCEIYRVLKKGGRLIILEFSLPKNRLIRALHLFYLRRILPHIAGPLSGNKSAYRYLNQTIETFPYGAPFCKMIEKAHFVNVRAIPLTFGIVTLYVGDKPL